MRMSYQGDITRLHKIAKTLEVPLKGFEMEVEDEDGWYTEGNVITFIEDLLEEVKVLQDNLYMTE